jgi:hypothetical protein
MSDATCTCGRDCGAAAEPSGAEDKAATTRPDGTFDFVNVNYVDIGDAATEAKEPEAKEPEAKEPEAKEPEAKEPEAKKPEAKKPEHILVIFTSNTSYNNVTLGNVCLEAFGCKFNPFHDTYVTLSGIVDSPLNFMGVFDALVEVTPRTMQRLESIDAVVVGKDKVDTYICKRRADAIGAKNICHFQTSTYDVHELAYVCDMCGFATCRACALDFKGRCFGCLKPVADPEPEVYVVVGGKYEQRLQNTIKISVEKNIPVAHINDGVPEGQVSFVYTQSTFDKFQESRAKGEIAARVNRPVLVYWNSKTPFLVDAHGMILPTSMAHNDRYVYKSGVENTKSIEACKDIQRMCILTNHGDKFIVDVSRADVRNQLVELMLPGRKGIEAAGLVGKVDAEDQDYVVTIDMVVADESTLDELCTVAPSCSCRTKTACIAGASFGQRTLWKNTRGRSFASKMSSASA